MLLYFFFILCIYFIFGLQSNHLFEMKCHGKIKIHVTLWSEFWQILKNMSQNKEYENKILTVDEMTVIL